MGVNSKRGGRSLCAKRVFYFVCVGTIFTFCFMALYGGLFSHTYVTTFYIEQPTIFSTGKKIDLHLDRSIPVYKLSYQKGQSNEWKEISIHEVYDAFRSKTLDSCVNKCDESDFLCSVNTYEKWESLVMEKLYPPVPLAPPYRYILPIDKEYLSRPPLEDLKKLPNLTLSRVFLSKAEGNVVRCQINDVITGRVDLVDSYGKPRTEGKDDVRVWLTGNGYQATGQEFDLNNGSYAFSFKCLWAGTMQLRISVSYPREFIRAAIYAKYVGKKWPLAGLFQKGEIQEVTVCHSMPNIAGRPCLCNLTDVNQRSFYCGRPLNPRLSCRDWAATHSLPTENVLFSQGITVAEKHLLAKIAGPPAARLIQHNFTVNVSSSGQLPSLPVCSTLNSSVTWAKGCKGYWSTGLKWNSLLCQPVSPVKIKSCLKNTSVWIIGDSNGVRLFGQMNQILPSKTIKPSPWPNQSVKKNMETLTTITFTPHEYPLFFGAEFVPKLPYGGVVKQIDAIPSTGKQILIFHLYLHIMPSHLAVARTRLEAARDAIARLLKRNPHAFVAFRGPHTSSKEWAYNHALGGDSLGLLYLQIVRDVFRNFQDKIIFLDGWEMSISIENQVFHPSEKIPRSMLNLMLSFICK